eukprot:15180119-Ditylum_brightwellii.AAC.1
MNKKSQSPIESQVALNLGRMQVYNWFLYNGSKEISSFEKPQLTDEHKVQSVEFVKRQVRRKLKLLPKDPDEKVGAYFVKCPKTCSHQFPIKIMYLGVVGRPQMTKHQQFTGDALVNHELKNGCWRSLHVPIITVDELCNIVVDTYDLDEWIAD